MRAKEGTRRNAKEREGTRRNAKEREGTQRRLRKRGIPNNDGPSIVPYQTYLRVSINPWRDEISNARRDRVLHRAPAVRCPRDAGGGGEKEKEKSDGRSCLWQSATGHYLEREGSEPTEQERERERKRDGERERGVRTNRNVLFTRLETAL